MRVSLILTVKNEAESLPRLLDSIAAQTRMPDEIVIADGGSSDRTLDILSAAVNRLPLKMLSLPGANISQGRNAASRAACGDVICSTDAGVWLHKEWLKEIVQPLEDEAKDEGRRMKNEKELDTVHPSSFISHTFDVVSGFFIADPHTIFETALAATTLPVLSDIRPEKFLPSSRSIAFRKTAWEKIRGYPEWLDYCEDLVFDFALHAAGFRFTFAPSAVVFFRPRPNLRAFFEQYHLYARGDGKANLWLKRHLIRYATYPIALPLSIALLFSTFWFLGVGILVFGSIVMFYTPYKRLLPMLRKNSALDKICAIAWVPVIRVAGDIAKMVGYPVGVVWRVRNSKRIQ